jgi:hypothetical protein
VVWGTLTGGVVVSGETVAGDVAAGSSVTDCGGNVVAMGTATGSVGAAMTGSVGFGAVTGHGAKAQPFWNSLET